MPTMILSSLFLVIVQGAIFDFCQKEIPVYELQNQTNKQNTEIDALQKQLRQLQSEIQYLQKRDKRTQHKISKINEDLDNNNINSRGKNNEMLTFLEIKQKVNKRIKMYKLPKSNTKNIMKYLRDTHWDGSFESLKGQWMNSAGQRVKVEITEQRNYHRTPYRTYYDDYYDKKKLVAIWMNDSIVINNCSCPYYGNVENYTWYLAMGNWTLPGNSHTIKWRHTDGRTVTWYRWG